MRAEWDPGCRVGLGFNSQCDGWDCYLSWTYMHNNRKQTSKVPRFDSAIFTELSSGTNVLTSPWDYGFGGIDFDEVEAPMYDKIVSKWRLNYNMFDLELGRKYWLSECFNMRPFTAIRGGWTRTRFNVSNEANYLGAPSFSTNVTFQNKIWGVGIVGGVQPTWYFSPCFALFANADFALLWGRDDMNKSESIERGQHPSSITVFNTNYSMDSSTDSMQAVLDLALGFRVENTFCCNRYRFTLDLGWENHQWIQYLHRSQVTGVFTKENPVTDAVGKFYTGIDNIYTDLSLSGLTLRTRLDF